MHQDINNVVFIKFHLTKDNLNNEVFKMKQLTSNKYNFQFKSNGQNISITAINSKNYK